MTPAWPSEAESIRRHAAEDQALSPQEWSAAFLGLQRAYEHVLEGSPVRERQEALLMEEEEAGHAAIRNFIREWNVRHTD